MAEHRIPFGLVVERIALDNPWSSVAWLPTQVLASVPETAAWTELARSKGRTTYYAGAFELALHPSSTARYLENLALPSPSIWVAMQASGEMPPVIAGVTADPSEGESFTETGASVVEKVPMPESVAATIKAYTDEYHVERVFEKRQRDKRRPQMLDVRKPTPGRG